MVPILHKQCRIAEPILIGKRIIRLSSTNRRDALNVSSTTSHDVHGRFWVIHAILVGRVVVYGQKALPVVNMSEDTYEKKSC